MAWGNRKGPAQQAPADDFDKAHDWEASKLQLMEESRSRAWRTVTILAVLVVLSWVAIVLMMPLKQTVPYVIRVDSATGVPDIVTVMNKKGVEYNDVMDKYWLARYVRAREGYDWYTLQDDYNAVGMMSTPDVGKVYGAQFAGDNALDKKLGNNTRIKVDVLSVVPTGRGTATVRYVVRQGAPNSPTTVDSTWIATIAYEYRNPSVMKESYRLVNPFGFQVRSYRKDPEIVGGAR